jgi:hypothetical protein
METQVELKTQSYSRYPQLQAPLIDTSVSAVHPAANESSARHVSELPSRHLRLGRKRLAENIENRRFEPNGPIYSQSHRFQYVSVESALRAILVKLRVSCLTPW